MNDCYILHSPSFKRSRKLAVADDVLDFQHESDEDQNGLPSGSIEISD